MLLYKYCIYQQYANAVCCYLDPCLQSSCACVLCYPNWSFHSFLCCFSSCMLALGIRTSSVTHCKASSNISVLYSVACLQNSIWLLRVCNYLLFILKALQVIYNEKRTYYEVAKYTGNSIEWIAYKWCLALYSIIIFMITSASVSFLTTWVSEQVPWAVLKVFHQIPLQSLAPRRYLLGRR